MTESNLFCSASLVKSLPKLSSIGVLDFSLVLGDFFDGFNENNFDLIISVTFIKEALFDKNGNLF